MSGSDHSKNNMNIIEKKDLQTILSFILSILININIISVTAQSICLYDDMTTDLVNIRALLVGWGKMAVPAGNTQYLHNQLL